MAKVTITIEDLEDTGEVEFNMICDQPMGLEYEHNTQAQKAGSRMLEYYSSLCQSVEALTVDGEEWKPS